MVLSPGPILGELPQNEDGARKRILDAAEELFAVYGFDATRTAKIAERASVPKGLLFYYFPKKIELLRTLLTERLPNLDWQELGSVVEAGDISGSLLRLAGVLRLAEDQSIVLRSIVFREVGTHPEVGAAVRSLRISLARVLESVLDASAGVALDSTRRSQAVQVFLAVMLDEANARRFGAPPPDLQGTAELVAAGLLAADRDIRTKGLI